MSTSTESVSLQVPRTRKAISTICQFIWTQLNLNPFRLALEILDQLPVLLNMEDSIASDVYLDTNNSSLSESLNFDDNLVNSSLTFMSSCEDGITVNVTYSIFLVSFSFWKSLIFLYTIINFLICYFKISMLNNRNVTYIFLRFFTKYCRVSSVVDTFFQCFDICSYLICMLHSLNLRK